MKLNLRAATLIAIFGVGFVSVQTSTASDGKTSHSSGAPHWSYEGPQGPAHWASVSHDFEKCEKGQEQSPVDLKWKKSSGERAIDFSYKTSEFKVVDNGHTVQVNFPAGSTAIIDGKKYNLKQMHYHAHSEHSLSGKYFPVEFHFVHADDDGHLAVLGVFAKEGTANTAFQNIIEHFPLDKGAEKEVDSELDPKSLLPTQLTHYNYKGSLTTPPCSEGVNWNVFNTPITLSAEQISRFTSRYANNFRPVQKLFERKPANY